MNGEKDALILDAQVTRRVLPSKRKGFVCVGHIKR
jgi:hypothetical protein